MALYYSYNKLIPNVKTLFRIDYAEVNNWVRNHFKGRINIQHSIETEFIHKSSLPGAFLYMVPEKMMIYQHFDYVRVFYPPGQENQADELITTFKRFPKKEEITSSISLVTNSNEGLDTVDVAIKKPKLSIDTQYNDDLSPIHKLVLKSLRTKDKSGLILLHGQPGTGKSTYIRYLLHHLSKKVIYISPKIAGNLDSPGMTNLLVNNQNSIFVLEDAEELLVTRNLHLQSGISMLLNMTDGLLGESLGIQIIATFNSKLQEIDPALLRKGRLIARYEFKPLDSGKAQFLLNRLGKAGIEARSSMTLADIYNAGEPDYQIPGEKNQIGFTRGRTG
jgi:hypothetical protein